MPRALLVSFVSLIQLASKESWFVRSMGKLVEQEE